MCVSGLILKCHRCKWGLCDIKHPDVHTWFNVLNVYCQLSWLVAVLKHITVASGDKVQFKPHRFLLFGGEAWLRCKKPIMSL